MRDFDDMVDSFWSLQTLMELLGIRGTRGWSDMWQDREFAARIMEIQGE